MDLIRAQWDVYHALIDPSAATYGNGRAPGTQETPSRSPKSKLAGQRVRFTVVC